MNDEEKLNGGIGYLGIIQGQIRRLEDDIRPTGIFGRTALGNVLIEVKRLLGEAQIILGREIDKSTL